MPYSDPFTTCTTRNVFLYCLCSVFFFCFFDKHYKPRPAQLHQHTTLLMAYVLFFCCRIILKKRRKKIVKNSLLQVVQLSVLAVQAAAGGHLSKYITVIWIKTTDVWNKNVLLTNYWAASVSFYLASVSIVYSSLCRGTPMLQLI